MERRTLGSTGIAVSPVGLGCLPFAGTTSLRATDTDSQRCVVTALDCGINLFDTAFAYGRHGESDRILRAALVGRRGEAIVATKVGIALDAAGKTVVDGSPDTLRRQVDESL